MAGYLNDWSRRVRRRRARVLRSATFFPEPGVAAYVARAGRRGAPGVQGARAGRRLRPLDPLLDEAWGAVADAGTPVVVHAGSGPVGNEHTGPRPDAGGCCARHPG